jgi:hypothetical protein
VFEIERKRLREKKESVAQLNKNNQKYEKGKRNKR